MTREEAIKKIKEAMPTLWKETKDAIQTLIPELAEIEDERVNNVLYCIVRDNKEVKRILEGNGVSVDATLAYLEKQKEQKPVEQNSASGNSENPNNHAEWSEEDKDYYDAIIAKLEVTQDDAMLTDNQINFLKSLRSRLKSLRPHPSWKPSKEQMEALDSAQAEMCSTEYNKTLCSLIDDLKNL